jgi:transcriptional regulator GlxA family with amidase domain
MKAPTRRSVAAIAKHCGFGTIETMRRSFRRVIGVTARGASVSI